MSKIGLAVSVGIALFAGAQGASAADVSAGACVRPASHARIVWKSASNVSPAPVRVYFRSTTARTEHYVDMVRAGNGYMAILPKPADTTESIEYRIVSLRAKGEMVTVQKGHLSVIASCAAAPLTVDEAKFASSLVIGSDADASATPAGFRCDGVVGRIASNQMRACNACSEEAHARSVRQASLTAAVIPPQAATGSTTSAAAKSLQAAGSNLSGLTVAPLHHRTPRRDPLPPTPPQPRLSEPVSPSRP